MNHCSCKGVRKCIFCNPDKLKYAESTCKILYYCPVMKCLVEEPCLPIDNCQVQHAEVFPIDGVFLQEGFLSEQDRTFLLNEINSHDWINSQSGRRKQDYGPKVNFKKKKINAAPFTGLPPYARSFIDRIQQIPFLQDFRPVELCNLEYNPSRGASIDPHLDDSWLWGERLVTFNVRSSTYLTLVPVEPVEFTRILHKPQCPDGCRVSVKVPLPEGSLFVLYGDARYNWLHAVDATDISSTRVATTLRELSDEFMDGGAMECVGQQLLNIAESFGGVPIAELCQ